MDFLGIGPLELVIVFVLILLILGPNDMVKAGKSIGEIFRKVALSNEWQGLRRITREIRTLPNRMAREAQLDELKKQVDLNQEIAPIKNNLNKQSDLNLDAWTQSPTNIKGTSKSDATPAETESPES